MLAGIGIHRLATDMYGEGKQALHPEDAKAFSSAAHVKISTLAKARFVGRYGVSEQQASVDPTRIAAIGYLYGRRSGAQHGGAK